MTANDSPTFPGMVNPARPTEITWEAVEQALDCLGVDPTGLRGVGIDLARVHLTYLVLDGQGRMLTFDGQPAEVTFPIPITACSADTSTEE